MIKNLKCVIFDLDGVITETSNQHFEAWQHMASKIGISLEPSFEEQLKGVSRKESLERILRYGNVSLSEEEKIQYQKEKNDHYQQLISTFDQTQLFDGVKELITHLKERHIKVALGSASKNGPSLIQALGIAKSFDYVVDPSQCRSKPEPDIFLDAMHHFGFSKEECLCIEDAKAGVKAIKAAGMKAIGIGSAEQLNEADIVFPTTLEAAQWLMSQT